MQRGLGLASGGARGAYQAGALLLLSERGIQFDGVAGTSIGALNGAFYAQGDGSPDHAERLCQLWRSMPAAGVIQISGPAVARAAAMVFARELPTIAVLLNRVAGGSFAVLDPAPVAELMDEWIDYEAVCTSPREFVVTMLRETDPIIDIVTAPWRGATYFSARELGPAQLKLALLASAAIPLAFPSQKVRGKRYGDAGIADPLPALELHRRGAKQVVSVFLADDTPQNRADFVGSTVLQIRPSEIIDTGLRSTFDFSSSAIERLIELGYKDAKVTISEAQDLWERMISLRAGGDANIALADALPDRRRK